MSRWNIEHCAWFIAGIGRLVGQRSSEWADSYQRKQRWLLGLEAQLSYMDASGIIGCCNSLLEVGLVFCTISVIPCKLVFGCNPEDMNDCIFMDIQTNAILSSSRSLKRKYVAAKWLLRPMHTRVLNVQG
jgi:hypothetical protein